MKAFRLDQCNHTYVCHPHAEVLLIFSQCLFGLKSHLRQAIAEKMILIMCVVLKVDGRFFSVFIQLKRSVVKVITIGIAPGRALHQAIVSESRQWMF
jgi:hypothetical protein